MPFQTEKQNQTIGWRKQFSDRELSEIKFSCLYAEEFNHGTDGHLIRNVVAKMAALLDRLHIKGE